ncbi:glycerophosphodiester phosphodiesterase [Mechercharimyces sp. CAU 1602]|uniref:glycerophosphodiester phosphodiesterase n=1 Tax=Mechercharimyces sp. CAU 1602 TaxID=2973933 RepID=UPI00216260A1|nr:glycerophosphodiester phosphodiesterase [Mechercharimyces sp. CAU 1602]MCS1350575.1 glycerophosphodiester phosphodiesterase [Mechercharimyces sp. CAU 1602]
MQQVKVYAHRGFSAQAPENTMGAFRAAIEAGADGIELDVQLTRDGEVVVIHDDTVDRTTDGRGEVSALSLLELQRLEAGSWFAQEFVGEKIPSLRDVLALVSQHGLELNIELKSSLARDSELEQKVLAQVKEFDWLEKTIFSSFQHERLKRLLRIEAGVSTAPLYMAGFLKPWRYCQQEGFTSIHPYYMGVQEEVVTGCHQHGIKVRTYTVNEEEWMKRFIHLGVDAIMTDHPDRLRKLIDQGY